MALSAPALLATAGLAAANSPTDLPNRQAAVDTLNSADTRTAICDVFDEPVPDGSPGSEVQIPDRADPCEGVPSFTIKDPVALNEITPGFVDGTARPVAAEAIELSYALAEVTFSGGRTVTAELAPTGTTGWHLAAVEEGDTEVTYASRGDDVRTVFSEPEIDGFYQLTDTVVEPLNDAARQGLNGADAVPLAEYQRLVKARYADEGPGSAYDQGGLAGGFGTTAPARSSQPSAPVIAGGSSAALALAFGAFRLHRRKRSASR
ncbi:hypothetical protein [Kitasatospora mediocidica]|uniref:hypothetical protein n=1 Tax=Kitasatospora mediocidica TaxID=58352 RepID=UPI000B1F0D34|nr:hypothetical protein [Kitasatospora mediocidica]